MQAGAQFLRSRWHLASRTETVHPIRRRQAILTFSGQRFEPGEERGRLRGSCVIEVIVKGQDGVVATRRDVETIIGVGGCYKRMVDHLISPIAINLWCNIGPSCNVVLV